LQIITFIRSE